jgi:endonuclease/exonuclease/phosphatase family metal-dependent hydrolase
MDPASARVVAELARSRRLRRIAFLVIGGALSALALFVIALMLMINSIIGSMSGTGDGGATSLSSGCTTTGGAVEAATGDNIFEGMLNTSTVASLTDEQERNAAAIVGVGQKLGVSGRGLVIALATALQESTLRNLDYGDRDSLGLFQQRPSTGWGTPEQVTDPVLSAQAFFGRAKHTNNTGLLDIEGWQTMPITVAAQAVQRSAFPDAYADDEPLARRIVTSLGVVDIDVSTSEECLQLAGDAVVYPLPASSGYYDQTNFGDTGGAWSRMHTGTDLSVGCGTPVLAATGGRVVRDASHGSWAGPYYVRIETGRPGSLSTWYAHMQSATVEDGDIVQAGEQIGEVGDLGNSFGCHLHFEVHPTGGTIYEDPVDPTPWLATQVGEPLPGVFPVDDSAGTPGGDGLVAATFNVLGYHHTEKGGFRASYASGTTRMKWALNLLEARGVTVVALQEYEKPQHRTLLADGDWDVHRGSPYNQFSGGQNTASAIAVRSDVWSITSTHEVAVPWPKRTLHVPIAVIEHRETGAEYIVVSVHNPLEDSGAKLALQHERKLVQRLSASTGVPVLFMGDFNDRARAFCTMTSGGQLHAAVGGTNDGTGCKPPTPYSQVDWIFGSSAIQFSNHTVDKSPNGRISDHPLIYSRFSSGGTT